MTVMELINKLYDMPKDLEVISMMDEPIDGVDIVTFGEIKCVQLQ